MAKILTKQKIDAFDKVLRDSSIHAEIIKPEKMDRATKVELKSHAIKKALKLKKYVRN